jgi:hypothetical protein
MTHMQVPWGWTVRFRTVPKTSVHHVRAPCVTDLWWTEATPEGRMWWVPHAGGGSAQHGAVGQPKLPVLYLLCVCVLRRYVKICVSKEERRRPEDPPTSII